jgi:hypothetical protein
MLAEIQHQPHRAGPLAFDIEQNVRWRWKRLTRCVADRAERKQWNAVLGASARNKLRFHIHRRRACRSRNFVSLLAGIDYRRHRQKIGDMDRQIYQQGARLAQFSCREVLGEQEIANVQLIVKRACESRADQAVELPILKEPRHPLSANLFSNSGVKDLNRATVDLASDRRDTVSIGSSFVVKKAQKF